VNDTGSTAGTLVFACDCGANSRVEISIRRGVSEVLGGASCGRCGVSHPVHAQHLTAEGGLLACLRCGHPELFTRKHFPAGLGITIVVIAAVLAPWTHYLSLVVAALIDMAIHRWTPDVVVCYVCAAEHRGFHPVPRHPRYDREIAERLRFGPKAVMGKPMRPGGTANAPEPEH
jgi:hypothetical protein